MTTVRIAGLRFFGYHGVLEEEARLGQRFSIEIEAEPWADLAETSDDVADAIHYGELAEQALALATGQRFNLLEALAGRIADELFAAFPLQALRVTVEKPAAPVPVVLDTVTVTVERHATEHVVVALGANLGPAEETLREAVSELAATPGVELQARSRLYRSAPVGGPEQPVYLNGAVSLRTRLEPHALLDRLQEIESVHGRTREVRWGARTLDLDLALFGSRAISSGRLTVPHPRLAERRFVLEPLLDVAPNALVRGRPARLLAAQPGLADQELEVVGLL